MRFVRYVSGQTNRQTYRHADRILTLDTFFTSCPRTFRKVSPQFLCRCLPCAALCIVRRIVLFCSVLQPSSIRGLATPWTYFLHLYLSSVILIDSSTGKSCPRIDVLHPGRAWSSSPACTWHCSLHYLLLQATPLCLHGVTTVWTDMIFVCTKRRQPQICRCSMMSARSSAACYHGSGGENNGYCL